MRAGIVLAARVSVDKLRYRLAAVETGHLPPVSRRKPVTRTTSDRKPVACHLKMGESRVGADRFRHVAGLRKCHVDLNGSLVLNPHHLTSDSADGSEVGLHSQQVRQRLGSAVELGETDLGLHRDACLGLGAANLDQRSRYVAEQRRIPTHDHFIAHGPATPVDRAVFPPGPHLFCHVGQDRREQPEHDVQRERQSCPRGRSSGVIGWAVSTLLDQFQVVVAELPEELFGTFQRAGVVVRLERRLSHR